MARITLADHVNAMGSGIPDEAIRRGGDHA